MPTEVLVAFIGASAVVIAALIGLWAQARANSKKINIAVENTNAVGNGFTSHVRSSLDQLCKDVGHLVARDEELARRIENLERRTQLWHQ